VAARNARRIARRIAAVGSSVGIAGLALFAGLHALVIKPVWRDLAGGLPFVIAIGIAVTWAYHEFLKVVPKRVCATGGLRFGAMMWLSALPATALANVMRVQVGGPLPIWVDVASFALALVGGALVIGGVAKSRRAALAGAVAAAVLLSAAGGPLPVIRGGRVLELWFGLFVLETAGGVVLAWLYRRWILPLTPAASAAPVASPAPIA
jgi:hypothetical protein